MKTGYHAVYAKSIFDGIDAAQIHSFDFVQFDLGVPAFFLDGFSDEQLRQIRDYAKDRDIRITFHAPGDNVSLFCDYPLIRAGILDQFKLILEKANILDARHVTFHAGIVPRFKKSDCKTDNFSHDYEAHYSGVLYENLDILTQNCGDVLVCLENYNWSAQIMHVAERLMDEGSLLYLTLDTAKLYNGDYTVNEEVYVFMRTHSDLVRELHIHDMNRIYGSHQTVGTGEVDFSLFKSFCNENVYLNFEVRPVEAAEVSRKTLFEQWKV